MSEQQLRKSNLSLVLPPSPAVGAGQASFLVSHPQRLITAQAAVSDTGTGAGATTLVVNVNGVPVVTSVALSVAQGAAVKTTKGVVSGSPSNYPGGLRLNIGDLVTVDVTAVPLTTSPKLVTAILGLTQLDV